MTATVDAAKLELEQHLASSDVEMQEYERIKSWADLYGTCTSYEEKMIISQFIKSVYVYRDCTLEIEFNVSFEDFKATPHNSARVIRERFSATTRRDFAEIIGFISRNHNEVVAQKIREAPKPQLCGAALRQWLPNVRSRAAINSLLCMSLIKRQICNLQICQCFVFSKKIQIIGALSKSLFVMDPNKPAPDNSSASKLKPGHVVGSLLFITNPKFAEPTVIQALPLPADSFQLIVLFQALAPNPFKKPLPTIPGTFCIH